MADIDALSRLVKKADAVVESASVLVNRTIREIRGELSNLSDELNLAGSAKDRETVYADIRRRMAKLSRRLDSLMAAQNQLAAKTAAKQASEMTGLEVKYSAKRAEAITQLVTPAQGENLAAVFTERMSANLISSLQSATVAMLRHQAVEGGTMRDMTADLARRWREAAKVAEPVFTDAGGRSWDAKTYLTMNVRTNTMRVYNDCLLDDIARATGSDVARISTAGSDPHCICAAWEGVVISISGKTKGLPTYEQARNAGCFHPNCVHTLEYIDEDADADEIELQKAHPVEKGREDDPDAADERKYEIDQDRYRRQGKTKEEARLAVDRDNLTASLRTGLIRSDAREIVDKLTDAQVTALCKDGNPPRFEPFKPTKKELAAGAKERWNHGSRGGVVHIKRDASVEDLVRVAKIEEWVPQTELEKKTDALMQSIGAKHTDKTLGIDGVNPNYANGAEYRNNCQRCVPTYEARMRGYEVEALSSDGDKIPGLLNLAKNSRAVWKNQQIETFTAKKFKAGVEKRMAGWGDGARAEVRIGWKGRRFGHVFVAVQENGVTKFVDPQHPSSDASQYFSMAARSGANAFHWLLRIDDNEFTDEAKRCFKHL